MDRNDLLTLARLADERPTTLRDRHPEVFATVTERVAARAKAYLRTSFPGLSPQLREHLNRLDLPLADWPDREPKELLLERLAEQDAPAEVMQEAHRVLASLEQAGQIPTKEDLKRSINQLPFFEQELEQATVAKLAGPARIRAAKVERLASRAGTVRALSGNRLNELVRDRTLSRAEATRLGLATGLYNVTDRNEKLMSAVTSGRFASVAGGRVRGLRDLAALTAADWASALESAKVRAPAGKDREGIAREFERRATAAFPTDALLARTIPAKTDFLGPALTRMAPVLTKNTTVFERPFSELDVSDLSSARVRRARAAHEELRALSNLHPGLRLGEVFGAPIGVEEKVRIARRRLDLMTSAADINPDTELLVLDYRPDSSDLQALKFDGFDTDEQRMVLANLKAHQRIFAITNDAPEAVRLLGAGYSTARSIATTPFESFVKTTGLPASRARSYYLEAKGFLADASAGLVAINDLVAGGINIIGAAGNTEPAVLEYLRKLEGYADLFGSQDYCACEHCQSILSPAAYFVDLMLFTEEQALGVFTGPKADHALNLKVRRPDLWKLELTCQNTDELIPTLDLINPILENAIAIGRGFPAANLGDRVAVEEEVYHAAISNAVDSFRQPFVLPLEKLSIYLSHFERSQADVARMLAASPAVLSASTLRVSEREYQLITQPDAAIAFLRGVYGIQFVVGAGGKVDPIDVQEMLRFTGLSRRDFGDLVATNYVTANGADPVEIKAEKKAADSLQNDIERIRNLTLSALDRLHRLTRLWRQVGWSITEVDLALTHAFGVGIGADINEAIVQHLATFSTVLARWTLPVEQGLAFWSELPTVPAIADRKPLLDRLFNIPPFVTTDGPFPNPAVSFVHPSLRQSGTALPSDNTLNRVLAGLQTTEDQLGQLITGLAVPLGANLADANEDNRGFVLSLANLTLLYRHARLSQLLRLAPADLFQLIHLSGNAAGHVATLGDMTELLAFHDWWKSSGFKLDDLGFVTHGPVLVASQYPDPISMAAQIVSDIAAEGLLQFADTIFAFLPGVTEDQSRQIIAANPAVIERTPDGAAYRLSNTFDPSVALTIPGGIAVAEPDARAHLIRYHSSTVLPVRLATRLPMTIEKMGELIGMTGLDLNAGPMVDAIWGGAAAALETLIGRLAPLTVLFRHPVFDASALQFIRAQATRFGIADFNAITMANVRSLAVYIAWTDSTKVPADAPEGTAPDPDGVRSVLTSFDPVTKFAPASLDDLANALYADPVLLSTLLPNLTLPATAPEALGMVGQTASLAKILGVGGEALALMISADYHDLTRASDAVLSSLRARYPDEKQFLDQAEPLLDRLRSRRRDALVDYLIRSADPQFHSASELYAYYLLDVELEGCARTSRLVAGISSLQLYVTRCLLSLEQDDLAPDDPNHVRIQLSDDAIAEWAWRKNYRVWEANRKVFLYPETYIEPELRDDKTPLFKELESTLLQQRITEQNVLDAYSTYLGGFEEVARLKIAGSYHDIGASEDTLHLFGVMPGDPPVYYYRTVENAYHGETGGHSAPVYTPWRKIDVQIPVRYVTPIVYLGRLFVFWVETTTASKNAVTSNGSEFVGYKHTLHLRYTSLRLDGRWTAPQSLTPDRTGVFAQGEGVVNDWLSGKRPNFDDQDHNEPIDGYTLTGFQWDRVYPGREGSNLELTLRNFLARGAVDFYRKQLPTGSAGNQHAPADAQVLCSRWDSGLDLATDVSGVGGMAALAAMHILAGAGRKLYYGRQTKFKLDDYAHTTIVADERRLDALSGLTETSALVACLSQGLYQQAIARLSLTDEIEIINGAVTDAIIDANGDLMLLQGSVRPGPDYLLKRLGTTLTETMVRTLFTSGVHGLLATDTQKELQEAPIPIGIITAIENAGNAGKLDFKGPYGTYYREVFFHIPALVANHLNSQQRFSAAQQWYHFIFDPTSTEAIALPAGLTEEEQKAKLRNRVWRYLEFRDLGVPKLQDILSDPAAIEVYRKDPFNPHAIARLRLSAYQKNIVMKYIDNLLDWGDSLFAQFTTESLNEATLLYVMAQDILGRRPAALGECSEEAIQPRTYETIGPLMKAGQGFLGELETYVMSQHSRIRWRRSAKYGEEMLIKGMALATYEEEAPSSVVIPRTQKDLARPYGWHGTWIGGWVEDEAGPQRQVINIDSPLVDAYERMGGFAWSIARQFLPVFCIPPNKDLLAYYDRVEDRLYKLRHCLDLDGVFRRPALFAPEIDPRLLVRARAAGLSIEDVLNATSGNLPPYRFIYLVEKAKQAVGTVQGFGAALMSALEKKDLEELNRLRTVHQQNLLKMTSRLREWDITVASDAITQLERQQAAVEYRKQYYGDLLNNGLTTWERTQQVSRHIASGLQAAAGLTDALAAVFHLIPQVGSPFAMKYGGIELGHSAKSWSGVAKDAAAAAEAISASAGLEAGFERRDEGWEHQVDLADHELKQIEKQLSAARLRKEIAIRSRDIHLETMKQMDELIEFYGERFSTLAFYSWLATTLQRTYREAYNSAYEIARLAEQAYRYERGDETTPLLQFDYWDATRAGLLAGERLMVDLQNMERRFIETNYRRMEIDQAFSLTQIAPAALMELRETGSCEFEVPELAFDLFYPGQHNRRISSARLTVPCITGPYTNVSATLTLVGSKIRRTPQLGAANLVDVPIRRSVTVATSTAQNDAGVFEFSFRDERYMPFEGAGAVSTWRLSLPENFRQFDYDTITDVMLHLSYTADFDGLFRQNVEQQNAAIEGTILNVLSNAPLARAFSLRQDFSSAFNLLVHSPTDTIVNMELGDRFLPIFIRGKSIQVTKALLVLRPAEGQSTAGFQLELDGAVQSGFAPDPNLGGLPATDVTPVFAGGFGGVHSIAVKNAGALAPTAPAAGDMSSVDAAKLTDTHLYVEFQLQ